MLPDPTRGGAFADPTEPFTASITFTQTRRTHAPLTTKASAVETQKAAAASASVATTKERCGIILLRTGVCVRARTRLDLLLVVRVGVWKCERVGIRSGWNWIEIGKWFRWEGEEKMQPNKARQDC
jgi:hypothetical protein